jgi:hypothetical protein
MTCSVQEPSSLTSVSQSLLVISLGTHKIPIGGAHAPRLTISKYGDSRSMIAVINCSCKWYLFQAKPACGAASPRNKIGPDQVSRGSATQPLISYVQVIP